MKHSGSERSTLALMGLALVALVGCSDGKSSSQVVSGTSQLTGDAGPPITGSSERTVDVEPIELELVSLSVAAGQIVELNRDIELVFNRPLDMASVSLNTVQIRSLFDGSSAVGTFAFKSRDRDDDVLNDIIDRRVLIFSPRCPTTADLSDAGLRPAEGYVIELPGLSNGASNTLRSTGGQPLLTFVSRSFTTPGGSDPAALFLDKTPGPPVPILRALGSARFVATRVEIGRDATDLVYFELDQETGEVVVPAGFELPANLYSDAATQVAFEVFFNQMVSPAETNFGHDRLRLEFQDAGGAWSPLMSRTELVSNCDTALVRLEPIGILPAGCAVRAVVLPGFADIVGQANLLTIDSFAQATVESAAFASLSPADGLADELLEEFESDTLEDDEALIVQRAEWSDGSLTGSLGVGGGGPGGDFDWYVRSGEIFFFDTTATTIVGGPDGIPTTQQTTVNGIVDVRDLIIEEGGEIRVQGPNPMQINASRSVIIRGTLDLSGFQGKDVATLNTGNQPESGGAGVAGGGNGGNSSENTTMTTLRGGTGVGAFQLAAAGGEGGESQFAPAALGKDARRPGGGGGGRFALDACDAGSDPDCNPEGGPFGLAAEAGFDGNPQGTGAESGLMPAAGGEAGASVFVDGDLTNDFFGIGPELDAAGHLVGMIAGELPDLWAGAGGGGGGDAIPGALSDPWNPGKDEKGGPGGGASGGLRIRALDMIVFGQLGLIRAEGARGGRGENTNFLDHVGGTGGSGSGGHVMLESATGIDFTDGGANLGAGPTTWISARGGPRHRGPVTSGGDVSFGGSGGPGVIQLHVPKPTLAPGSDPSTTHIFVPLLQASARDPLEAVSAPASQALFATIGAVSKAQSTWISVGEADKNAAGGADLVRFLFNGLDDEGRITTTNETVDDLAPILAGQIGGLVTIDGDAVTLLFEGAALDALVNDAGLPSNDIYLRTPALLRHFALQLTGSGASQSFDVVAASYDDAAVRLALTVDDAGGTLQQFVDAAGGAPGYELLPRSFRVATGGVLDALPDTAAVSFRFQATGADSLGFPDDDVLVDWTGKIEDLNTLAPGDLQFFRFQVEFDLDVNELGLTPDLETISLDFLRLPFSF